MRGVLDVPESLLPVQEAVAGALVRVEARFDRQLESDLPPVSRLVKHIERYRGKMLRPTMVLLCGLAAHEGTASAAGVDDLGSLLTDEHVGLGAVVEMVHMATLVHDDVLDEAEVRRRGETVNKMNDNETAVILGDYLIASAYHLCSSVASQQASIAVGDTAMVMTAGELLQLARRGDWSLEDATYFEIVQRKTAALIGLSCALGAAASGGGGAIEDALRTYGERCGVAFQIQDDLLDLTGEEGTVGKSVRRDLAKGKLTLPVVHALRTVQPTARGELIALIERASLGGVDAGDDEIAPAVTAILRGAGSVEYARSEAERLVGEAKDALSVVPASPARELLDVSADAVVARRF